MQDGQSRLQKHKGRAVAGTIVLTKERLPTSGPLVLTLRRGH